MTVYLDASIIVPLIVTEPDSEAVAAWFDDLVEAACLGRLSVGEAASALSRKQRMGELTMEQGQQALALLDEIAGSVDTIEHTPADLTLAGQLVRLPTPKLLMPDAIHLATCRRLRLRLATADADLLVRAAAEKVACVRPG
jgi:predicted nucleic acid-binding protein